MFEKLFKKKKVPKYTIKLTGEVWRRLPDLTKKQIAELLARLKQAEEERDELKKKLEEIKGKLEPEDVKVLKEALKQKKVLKKKKEKRKLALVPFAVVDGKLRQINARFIPYGGGLISGSKGVYRIFAGWELQESEDGIFKTLNFLLKKDKKDKQVVRLPPSPSADITILDKPYLVQKILTGVYDAPIMKDGTLVNMNPNPKNVKQDKAVLEVNRMLNKSLNEATKIIERMKQEKAKIEKEKEIVEAKNYELAKKYEELQVENQKLKNDLLLANYRADLATATSQDQTEKIKGMLRDYGTMLTSSMSAQVNEMLQRRLAWVLAEGNKILREELDKAYGTTIPDEVWSKIELRFNKMFERIMSSLPKLATVTPKKSPPSPPKGGKT